jgi:hypothetical protein
MTRIFSAVTLWRLYAAHAQEKTFAGKHLPHEGRLYAFYQDAVKLKIKNF